MLSLFRYPLGRAHTFTLLLAVVMTDVLAAAATHGMAGQWIVDLSAGLHTIDAPGTP